MDKKVKEYKILGITIFTQELKYKQDVVPYPEEVVEKMPNRSGFHRWACYLI